MSNFEEHRSQKDRVRLWAGRRQWASSWRRAETTTLRKSSLSGRWTGPLPGRGCSRGSPPRRKFAIERPSLKQSVLAYYNWEKNYQHFYKTSDNKITRSRLGSATQKFFSGPSNESHIIKKPASSAFDWYFQIFCSLAGKFFMRLWSFRFRMLFWMQAQKSKPLDFKNKYK